MITPKNTLSPSDLKQLEEFLLSDKTPDECMDISSLDGFLTAIVIGPDTLMPSQWLPQIWGETPEDEMIWDSMEETNQIMGLIMSYYNSIAAIFAKNPKSFQPLFYDNKGVTIIEEWCVGFMQGVELSEDSWNPLIDSKEGSILLAPILLYGTKAGWEELEKNTAETMTAHEKWVKMIPLTVVSIYNYWLPFRKSTAKATHHALSHAVGRNDPCPCGSGKKFKKCCMN